jgi:serine protease Do
MPTRTSRFFPAAVAIVASLVAGMVIASRLDLVPGSHATPLNLTESTNVSPFTGPLEASTFRTIATNAGPAVVSIITRSKQQARTMQDLFGFDQFGQRPRPQQRPAPQEREVQGAGSGFIVDASGYVLTNHHVVEGATSIEVQLASMRDGDRRLPARLIGSDQLTDTALIQITDLPAEGLPQATLGDSAQIGPGDWVMAIGNPFGLSNTVTVGIVSAVSRTSPQLRPVQGRDLEMIQTDAAINRGNSGGPLLNLRGEVVGINTAIFSDNGAGGNVGVGFAVPINIVKEVLPGLRGGKVVRSRIAVNLTQRLTSEDIEELGLPKTGGAQIRSIEAGGPADKAGLRVGDVIVEYNGKTVTDNSQLTGLVTRTAPNTTVPLKVVRDRKTIPLNVTVIELDLEAEQAGNLIGPDIQERQRQRQPSQETGFGMTIEPVSREMQRESQLPASVAAGAVVTDLNPNGPAAEAGLIVGDIILRVNTTPVSSLDQTSQALAAVESGRSARLVVWRIERDRQGQEIGHQILVNVRKR